jgi:glycosyltransferase involved in cell wall biosynthesis
MLISIIICTWNRARLLQATLQRLTEIDGLDDGPLELLVIDNNSTDRTADIVRSFETRLPIRRVFEVQAGQSHARNRGILEAHGDFLLWTDDDVLVGNEWLRAFRRAIVRHPEASIFGGPIHPWFETPPDPQLTAAFPAAATGFCGLDYARDEGPLHQGETVFGANMGFSRTALADVRFDTALGVSPHSEQRGEEVKLIRALTDRGHRLIWVPAMSVRHYVDPSRLTLQYLGKFYAARGKEFADQNVLTTGPHLGGVPRWLVREVMEAYLKALASQWMNVPFPTKRRLRSGPAPDATAPRHQRKMTWIREYRWLRGAARACRNRALV